MLDELSVKLSDKFDVILEEKEVDGKKVIERIKSQLQTESKEITVKILGAASPEDWSERKIAATFGVGRRTAGNVKNLQSGQILKRKTRSDAHTEETKALVREFFYQKEVSDTMPGKSMNDFQSVPFIFCSFKVHLTISVSKFLLEVGSTDRRGSSRRTWINCMRPSRKPTQESRLVSAASNISGIYDIHSLILKSMFCKMLTII